MSPHPSQAPGEEDYQMTPQQMPQPSAMQLGDLVRQIELGAVKVPQFQRDFVWSRTKSAKLIDSLLRGFPIGTFILWKTKEELRTVRNIGDIDFPQTPLGDYTQYVLDGQQRLTSIFATLHGAELNRDGKTDNFAELYIDLDAADDRDLVITDVSQMETHSYVPIHILLSEEILSSLTDYPAEYRNRMLRYRESIKSYSASIVVVQEASIDIATEIFTRINVSGVPLTVFEIMVAKTFDANRGFDLSEKTNDLLVDLEDVGYGTLREIVVLQAISAIMVKETRKRNILELDKTLFIDTWPRAEDGIRRAVDYLRLTLGVPVSELLPYQSILVPLTYFFANHERTPVGVKHDRLVDYFWRTSLAGHYSQSLDTRLAQDIRRMDEVLRGRLPGYDYPVNPDAELVYQNGEFKTGRAFVKAILCLLAGNEPRRFDNHKSRINVNNDWLKRANSKNYHHFFPKKILEEEGWAPSDINHIVNITVVDEELNKAKIRAKKPSQYMAEFAKVNGKIAASMKTHFIDIRRDGIWDKQFGGTGGAKDDYERFFERRCDRISAELKKRIITQRVDVRGQSPNTEDLESTEIPE